MNNREKGKIGEDIAIKYLRENNYKILSRNYTVNRIGEIDIIASIDQLYCFIEVKLRDNDNYGVPSEAVNFKKIKKIRKVSMIYMNFKKLFDKSIRFDVIEVRKTEQNKYEITHLENAF